jgi:hypothetical protein
MKLNRISLFRLIGAACFAAALLADLSTFHLFDAGWNTWSDAGLLAWILDGVVGRDGTA